MQVLKGQEKLIHDVSCFIFAQIFIVNDILEKFSALTILKDKETDFIPLPNLVKFNNVRMI